MGNTVYQRYSYWCSENGYCCESKKNFFEELRRKNLLLESGTIEGKTKHNVVKGYQLVSEPDTYWNMDFPA